MLPNMPVSPWEAETNHSLCLATLNAHPRPKIQHAAASGECKLTFINTDKIKPYQEDSYHHIRGCLLDMQLFNN